MKRSLLVLALVAALVLPVTQAGASSTTLMSGSTKPKVSRPTVGNIRSSAYASGSVVYLRYVLESEDSPMDLYRYSTATKTSSRFLKSDDGDFEISEPRISGAKVAYTKWQATSDVYDIYVYDLTAKKESRITSDVAKQSDVDISGNRLAFVDERNGNPDIYVKDIVTGAESDVCTEAASQLAPSISGSKVVYEDDRNGNFDIYYYDLATNSETRVTSSAVNQHNPVVSGTKIVFEAEDSTFASSIYIYDTETKVTKKISTGTASQHDIDISGSRVVWVAEGTTKTSLVLYDLTYGTRHTLISGTAEIVSPELSGKNIAYVRDGSVYLTSLRYPTLSASAPSKVKKGSRAKITGTFRTSSGARIAKRTIYIQKSSDNRTWKTVASVKTGSRGGYSYRTSALSKAAYFRASYKGGSTYLSARSSVKKVGLK